MRLLCLLVIAYIPLAAIGVHDYPTGNPEDEENVADYPTGNPEDEAVVDVTPPVTTDPTPIMTGAQDLEEMAQSFVLETKQIKIEEYPDAFNPTLIRFQGSLLLAFRTYDPVNRATNKIGLIGLDEDFVPVSQPTILQFRDNDPDCLAKRQDPRLITAGGRLFIAYNNVLKNPGNREIRRMLLAEVHYDGHTFYVEEIESLRRFEGERFERSEKNWVPFEYNGEVLLGYSILPHRIFRPLYVNSACQLIGSTFGNIIWNWGVLRGGTPALIGDDGEYLAFFHSSKSMETVHSGGQCIPHYFMGAYTFSPAPPFEVTRISPRPIVGKNFYHGPAYKTWKPLHVVFPGGYVADKKYIWIVYGRQDHELWVAKLDKVGLYDSLIPVSVTKQ